MKTGIPLLEPGDRARADGLVHIVGPWTTTRGWDGLCERVIEDYQPRYIVEMYLSENIEADRITAEALDVLQVAKDEPTTCLVCLVTAMYASAE